MRHEARPDRASWSDLRLKSVAPIVGVADLLLFARQEIGDLGELLVANFRFAEVWHRVHSVANHVSDRVPIKIRSLGQQGWGLSALVFEGERCGCGHPRACTMTGRAVICIQAFSGGFRDSGLAFLSVVLLAARDKARDRNCGRKEGSNSLGTCHFTFVLADGVARCLLDRPRGYRLDPQHPSVFRESATKHGR